MKYLGSLSEKRKGFLLRICVFVRRFGDEVSVMVEGAGCWTDETEKPGFSNAQLFVAYMLVWCEKFLAVLHISSAQWRGVDPLE